LPPSRPAAWCAPLNPAFTRTDFEFYLKDLRAQAMVVDETASRPVVEAASACGIAVLRIRKGVTAGDFTFDDTGSAPSQTEVCWPGPNDTALLLQTSGTTSRPNLHGALAPGTAGRVSDLVSRRLI
jgi:oxalate---CoA ligase